MAAYFVKADIGNFFNSIDKDILFNQIKKLVFEPWLLNLIEKVIYHDPRENVYMKSSKDLYELIPQYKRLYCADYKKGLPIGNLTSQFFSNIYLDPLDQFVKHELKCKYYCRYVDDMLLLHRDSGFLNHAYSQISKFLEHELKMKLNHKKKTINLVEKGFDFVGYVIKPNRMLMRKRTVNKSFALIKKWQKSPNKFSQSELIDLKNSINSYLGMSRHLCGYNYRKKICQMVNNIFISSDEEFTKIFLN